MFSELLVGAPQGADAIPTPVNKAAYKSFMGLYLKIDEVRPQFLGLCSGRCWGHKLPGKQGEGEGCASRPELQGLLARAPGAGNMWPGLWPMGNHHVDVPSRALGHKAGKRG